MSAVVARRYYLRGREHLRAGAEAEAARAFDAALQLSPGFVEARVGLALALSRTDGPRAAHALRAGLTHAVGSGRRTLLLALADVLGAAGDPAGAEQALSEAARLPGPPLKLADRLARLHARTGRFPEALAELLRAARGG